MGKSSRIAFVLSLGALLLALAPLQSQAATWTCAPRYSGFALQNYRDYETQVQTWHARYTSAPAGSPEQQNARTQVQTNSTQALSQIADPNTLLGYTSSDIEGLASETFQKLASAPAGSLIETFYRQANDSVWTAYTRNANYEISCTDTTDFASTVQTAEYSSQKARSSAAGSRPEAAYRQVAQSAWPVALQQVQAYGASSYANYRSLESMGAQFSQKIQTSTPGSNDENFYRQATDSSFNSGTNLFRTQVKAIATQDLYGIVSEYNQKSMSAPLGGPAQRFYAGVRDQAQFEINLRGSTPAPGPTPTGYYCTITTPRGVTYYGRSTDQFSAIAYARGACRQYEPYYICNQTAAYCRLQ